MVKQDRKTTLDVSIVLNVHHEGRAMQSTVRSLACSIDHALDKGIKVDLIIVLDRPNESTKKYVKENLPSLINKAVPITTREADFGDLGMSRNFGIELARGAYVGVVDADDLFAENLITACVTAIQNSVKPVIVHPEYLVSFGSHNEVMRLHSSTSPEFDKASIVEFNPWSSLSFAPKSIREKYKYRATYIGEGFGPEDWQWNVETLGSGIDHIIAPETAYFYRRKSIGSLAAAHATFHSLLYKSDLLRNKKNMPKSSVKQFERGTATQFQKTTVQKLSVAPRFVLAKAGKAVGPALRRYRRTQAFEHYARLAFRELLSTSAEPPLPILKPLELPDWLLLEWRKQHEFEHTIFPEKELLHRLVEYKPVASMFTSLYWELLHEMQLDVDYMFIIPWLKTGGADLVILNYISAILKVNPKATITVIATEPSDSPWKDKLPNSVKFVKLDEAIHKLNQEEQARLLGTLLIQVAPKRIHLVSSPIGFRTFAEYAKTLSRDTKLFASAFSVDHLPDGRRAHVILDYLNFSIDYIQKVLTDNQRIIDFLTLQQAMPIEKFAVNYQPYSGVVIKRQPRKLKYNEASPLNVLWAGRLDREKHPDILIQIAADAERLGLPIKFHVYGSQVLDKDDIVDRLQGHDNLTYHGGFSNGIRQLALDEYGLFLMTSEYEGMPNVLFEATGGGLPIMATNVGGVSEFIQAGKTGYLVSTYNDIEAYINLLREITLLPEEAYGYLANAQQLMTTRHSWEAFVDTLIKDDYISA